MNDIMKIIQALEDTNILLKGVTKSIKNETKEQKGRFLSMFIRKFINRKRNCKSRFRSSFVLCFAK